MACENKATLEPNLLTPQLTLFPTTLEIYGSDTSCKIAGSMQTNL